MTEKEDEWVYSAYITLRNGKRLYASQCGLQAFRFRANPDYEKSAKTKKTRRV